MLTGLQAQVHAASDNTTLDTDDRKMPSSPALAQRLPLVARLDMFKNHDAHLTAAYFHQTHVVRTTRVAK